MIMEGTWILYGFFLFAILKQIWCLHDVTSFKRKHVILSKDEANRFLHNSIFPYTRKNVISECCEETCNYEERREFAAATSWFWIESQLCEISLREARSCTCIKKDEIFKDYYECGTEAIGKHSCQNPCVHDKIYCQYGRKCISESQRCDSNNDCGNWYDEQYCKITNKHSRKDIIEGTKLENGSTYWGNVYVLDRAVCDTYWDENDANVLCRTLNFNSHTRGVSWKQSRFGNVSNNFIMDNVRCSGDESYIGECSHHTSHYPRCNSATGAGVTCVDPYSMTLTNGKSQFGGQVNVIGQPVCYDNWAPENAQVVCNQLFGDSFFPHGIDKVPVFSSRSVMAPPHLLWKMSVSDLQCGGKERDLTGCNWNITTNCQSNRIPEVECAKCTPGHLLSIVKALKPGRTKKETHQTIQTALNQLKQECRNWNCSEGSEQPKYTEFCKVYSFLETSLNYVEPLDETVIKLQTEFDYGNLLNHLFMQMSFSGLQDRIFQLGDKVSDFQRKLSSYFSTLAEYDIAKAQVDLEGARNGWKENQLQVINRQNDLRQQLEYILRFGFAMADIDRTIIAFDTSASLTNFVIPWKWSYSKVIEIRAVIAKMINIGAGVARLGFAWRKAIEKINKMVIQLSKDKYILAKKFSEMKKLLEAPSGTHFTLETASNFLKIYKDYGSSPSAHELSEWQGYIEEMIMAGCSLIRTTQTIPTALQKVAAEAAGACPTASVNSKVVATQIVEVILTEQSMIKSLAQIAQARVAQEAAKSLSVVLKDALNDQLMRNFAKWNSLLLLQRYKASLIKRACDYITYQNHGQEEEVCTRLLQNPDEDTGELISYNYKSDMCQCSTCVAVEDKLLVPAMVRSGNETLPEGVIDVSYLYKKNSPSTEGWVNFKIPSTKWLLDNGWITLDMYLADGSFFLQYFQPFLPPTSNTTNQYSVETRMFLTGNYLGGKEYVMGKGVVLHNRYIENYDMADCDNEVKSPYNIPSCSKHFQSVCVTMAPNNKGPIYPSLVGSQWRLMLKSPVTLTTPVPEGLFYVKARVKYCFKSSDDLNNKKDTNLRDPKSCCYDKNMYFDQVIASKKDGRDPCRSCLQGSTVRMYGFYCENCRPGYETGVGSYGCSACRKGMYKPHAGQGACQPCSNGTTTLTTGQDRCMVISD